MDMTRITSASNERIKQSALLLTRKGRREQCQFMVEGIKLIIEAAEAGLKCSRIYMRDDCADEYSRLLIHITDEMYCVSDNVISHLSDCRTPQGIIGQFDLPSDAAPDRILAQGRTVLLLDGISDCGNAGTLVRTAEAAGVCGIITTEGSVDMFCPKTVRSAMGSLFRIPVCADIGLCDIMAAAQEYSYTVASLNLSGGNIYQTDLASIERLMIAVGSEAHGVSAYTAQHSDIILTIPMHGEVESLNAAMAGGIAMFEAQRQKAYTK